MTSPAPDPITAAPPGPELSAHFFDALFQNAKKDGMLILDEAGRVARVNGAFSAAFGYTDDELRGQHLRTIFTQKDREAHRPEKELQRARQEGSASDDAYVQHKDGSHIWATGEIFYIGADGATGGHFVKVMHRIETQRMLDKFVFDREELVDTAFRTLTDAALVVIDTRLNVLRSNEEFTRLFGMPPSDGEPGRLPQMTHPLWKSEALRQRMRDLIVLDKAFTGEEFGVATQDGRTQTLVIRSKVMETGEDGVRQFLLMIRERQ